MSIEASKWATRADVQKSSSKLVLMNLAQLVRYNSAEWTVFASIEYLAKVTHLNRKTVIEAMARLRELGAIQDTGRRAGGNRSCVIYRLCPAGVPLIDAPEVQIAAGAGPARPDPQGDLPLETGHDMAMEDHFTDGTSAGQPWTDEAPPLAPAHYDDETWAESAPSVAEMAIDTVAALAPSSVETAQAYLITTPITCTPSVSPEAQGPAQAPAAVPATAPAAIVIAAPAAVPASAPASGSHRISRPHRAKRARIPSTSAAGAGATRLPAGWELPPRWHAWTHRERPHWSKEKVDAMATMFSAYWRSKPGQDGFSEDWFESWRLWVFRERDATKSAGKPWHGSWGGIVAKGRQLGLEQAPSEPAPDFRLRVHHAAGVPPPH